MARNSQSVVVNQEDYPSWLDQQKALGDILYFADHILQVKQIWPEWRKVLADFYKIKDDGLPQFREMVACVGMGSGKTYIAAIICTYEFYKLINMVNPQEYWNLDESTPIYIVNCAKSMDQALFTVFAFIKGFMIHSPYFAELLRTGKIIKRFNEFEHPEKRIYLRSEHSASGSLAGKTAKCVVFDELAKFDFTSSGESAADEVYGIVTKSTGRFGSDGKIVSISSPITTEDLFFRNLEKGKQNPALGIYSYHKPTWEVVDITIKPEYAFDSPMMTAEREKDYDKFMRDYGAQPVGRLVPFFPDTHPILKCLRHENQPVRWTEDGLVLEPWFKPEKYTYIIAGDPALKRDAFGIAMGHMKGNHIWVDFATKFEKIPPALEINAVGVRDFVMSILDRGFKVAAFVTDIKSYPELFQALEKRGVVVEQSFVKKEQYDYLKERINLREISWPENPDLFDELSHLEIISQKKVDHPRYGSKDISDALANVAFFIKEYSIQKPAWIVLNEW